MNSPDKSKNSNIIKLEEDSLENSPSKNKYSLNDDCFPFNKQNQSYLETYFFNSVEENEYDCRNIQVIDLDSNRILNSEKQKQIKNFFLSKNSINEINKKENKINLKKEVNNCIKNEKTRYVEKILIENTTISSQINMTKSNLSQNSSLINKNLNELTSKNKNKYEKKNNSQTFHVFTPKLNNISFNFLFGIKKNTNNLSDNGLSQMRKESIISLCCSSEEKPEKGGELFKTTRLGRKRHPKKPRKFKTDDIRKKIKSRFHKHLKLLINMKLKSAGSLLFFESCPQCMIGNVSKNLFNKEILGFSYKKLIETNFFKNNKHSKEKIDSEKYQKNLNVLKYLEENKEISKISGFDEIKKLTYEELLYEYFNSTQFEESILKLKEEEESDEYINKYIFVANCYIEFFKEI